MDEQNDTELVPKKGAVSSVWRHFGFQTSDTDQKNIICKCCRAKVIASGGNTSNLLHHLRHNHPVEYEDCLKHRSASSPQCQSKASTSTTQTTLRGAFEKGTLYDKKSKRWNEITNAVTFHLAIDMVPLSTVEKRGFREMVKTLDPRYVLPSRNYFSRTAIPDLYTIHRAKVEAALANVSHFSATTDLWSSRTMEPYLSLTVHFISDDWLLQSHCLQTGFFPDDHTFPVLPS